jgi:N-acetyl-gamma-glutamyl-phosphate reductase
MALVERGIRVVDLGSDFRLDSPHRYREAYDSDHPYPHQLGAWVYGIPELFGDSLVDADRVAAPGCYPTSVVLGLGPLVADGLISSGDIVVDAMSGASGAGRGVSAGLQFGAVAESAKAYKVLEHRHQPEMESALEALDGTARRLTFTPHLIPMQRGILATIHAPLADGVTEADVFASLDGTYADAPFVSRLDVPPETRWVAGSNNARIYARRNPRTGRALILSAIDNLVKGAAGQAVQCANVMFGLDEAAGLPTTGAMP